MNNTDRKHASVPEVLCAIDRLWSVANESDWNGSFAEDAEDERITCGNPFQVEPSSARDDDPSVVFWSDLPGNRMGAAVIMDCGIWVSTTWPKLAG